MSLFKKLFTLLLFMGMGMGVGAQESVKGVALVVGNSAYQNAPGLENPVNDATDMAQTLKDLGWDVVLCQNAKLTTFRQALRDFSKKMAGQKAGFFYYAGHGVQVEGVNYLIPIDADISLKAEVPDVSVSADSVLRTMEASQVPIKIMVLDACRENPFEKVRGAGTRGLSVVPANGGGSIIIYATGPGDVSQDGSGRNGVFTQAFLANMKKPGLEFSEIFAETGKQVGQVTGGKQVPRMDRSFFGKLYLISPGDAQAQAEKRLDRLKDEQERLKKEIADREAAIARAKTASDRERLELEQQRANAQAAAQKEEQEALERAKTLAGLRAEEEGKNKASADQRARDAEAQLASLKKQAEDQRRASETGQAGGESPDQLIPRLKALDGGIAEVREKFTQALDRRVADTVAAYDQRVQGISRYQMDPWESQKEFEARKAQAVSMTLAARDNEVGGLRFNFDQGIKAQTAELVNRREELRHRLLTQEWPISASHLTLGCGAFDRDQKQWTLWVKSTQPAFEKALVYQLHFNSTDELRTLYTAFDTAWKAQALAAQARYTLEEPLPGYYAIKLKKIEVVNLTKKNEVVVASEDGGMVGWWDRSPDFGVVTLTVPRKAVVWQGGRRVADLGPGDRVSLKSTDYGVLKFKAVYGEGDSEFLSVSLARAGLVLGAFKKTTAQNALGMVMLPVEGGSFSMGSPRGEAEREAYVDGSEVQHRVRLTGFRMAATVVTQAQWQRVMGKNPSVFKGDSLPVETVTWYDAVEFCNRLSLKEGRTPAYQIKGDSVTWDRSANGYRLPTDAEWEYAARAGTTGPFYTGDNLTTDQANFNGSPYGTHEKGVNRERTTPVGSFPPNPWGFYDMAGNVWQWCWDRYVAGLTSDAEDPTGPNEGANRVKRGGSWRHKASYCRSAVRVNFSPETYESCLGFRVVLSGESD